MEWTDDGIILGLRRHGEANAIVELLTASHGRHLGLVRGGGSRRQAPSLQPGNSVQVAWRARLDEQLGAFTLEVTQARAERLMQRAHSAFAISHLGSLVRQLPERDPHPELYATLEAVIEHLDEPSLAGMLLARFELAMLAELGFGLELDSCAATGGRNDLLYVSPKSGRAVSRDAGEPWRAQLFPLPFFLIGEVAEAPIGDDLRAAFELTGYFLARRVFEPRGAPMPDARAAFLQAVLREVPARRREL
ncbi:DNA repair protein RecO [Ancylobacter sonchi]|uniref:DNA repair protein RecO n=1 Tax=Ancylobacter sonchi TaxID=1937790 RepID=UPI001BD5F24A|nr:DNA repair protein RecO [Ancylobacter sonchi]MBS7536157.1 DNA repair protein RecO [Ancylobacter sonchi]